MHPLLRLAILVFLAAIAAMCIAPPLERKYGKSNVLKWGLVIAIGLLVTIATLVVVLMT